jgi:hypothetical protein
VRSRTAPGATVLLVALGVAVLAGGCSGSSGPKSIAGRHIADISAGVVPASLNGLVAQQEHITDQLVGINRSYVEATSLYSFRTGDLLQSTLQVSRFTTSAAASTEKFRGSVVSKIGSTVPKPFRVANETVYLTTGKSQSIAIWFRGRYLFVLAVRDDYDQPRRLLRRALEIKP